MIGAPPSSLRRLRRYEAVDPFALRVIVPGIMGAGLLVSAVVLIGDALRRATAGRTHGRHARVVAARVAAQAATAAGLPGPRGRPVGLWPPWAYAAVGAVSLGAGMYILVGSFWNFVRQPWAENIAWIWVVATWMGLNLLWIGTAAAIILLRWPAAPAFAWPLLRRTPLGASVSSTHQSTPSRGASSLR